MRVRWEGGWERRVEKFSFKPPTKASSCISKQQIWLLAKSELQSSSKAKQRNRGHDTFENRKAFCNNHRRAGKPLCSWDPSAELQNILPTLHLHPAFRLYAQGQEQGHSKRKGKDEKQEKLGFISSNHRGCGGRDRKAFMILDAI